MAAILIKSNGASTTAGTSTSVSWASGSASAGNLIVACLACDKDFGTISAPTVTGAYDDLIIIQESGTSATTQVSGLIAYKVAEQCPIFSEISLKNFLSSSLNVCHSVADSFH